MDNLKIIVEKAIQGDKDAFKELCYKKGKNIVYICIKAMGSVQDGEDAAQEAFISMQKGIHSLKNPEAFDSWMYAVVRNSCRKLRRNDMKNSGNLPIDDFEELIKEEKIDYLPQDILEDTEKKEKMMSVIDSMPYTMRMCVVLFYYEGLSHAEISKALEISVNTVKSSLQRAKTKMREEIKALEPEVGSKTTLMPSALITTLFEQQANEIVTSSVVQNCAKQAIVQEALTIGGISVAAKTASTGIITGKVAAAITSATSLLIAGVCLTATLVSANNPITSNPSLIAVSESVPQRIDQTEQSMVEDISSSEGVFVVAPSQPVQSDSAPVGAIQSETQQIESENVLPTDISNYELSGKIASKDKNGNILQSKNSFGGSIKVELLKNEKVVAQTTVNENDEYLFKNILAPKGEYELVFTFNSSQIGNFEENSLSITLSDEKNIELPTVYVLETFGPSIFLTTHDKSGKLSRTNPSSVELSISSRIKTSYILYICKKNSDEIVLQGDENSTNEFLQNSPAVGQYTLKAVVTDAAQNVTEEQIDFYIV